MSKEQFNSNFQLSHRKIRIALSPTCNMHCVYCDGSQSRDINKPGVMEDQRSDDLETGIISKERYVEIIQHLYDIGFRGVTFTGGEPMINREWDKIAREARKIGMEQVCLTTNGLLLSKYLEKHGSLPEELTLLTVSFDTFSADEFAALTCVDSLPQIIANLKRVRETNPTLPIRANHVILRSNYKDLPRYIEKCEEEGIFDEVNLLNLILKDPQNPNEIEFFKQEFIHPQEILEYLTTNGYSFSEGVKYEPFTETESGVKIILKDTDRTLRNEETCANCPIYCQEGFYTVRVATDGAIRTCIDNRNQLPFIDSNVALGNGNLQNELMEILQVFGNSQLENTLEYFMEKYGVTQLNSDQGKIAN
jgi:molybdenum cofactor biosynthesis enzyme MoaA